MLQDRRVYAPPQIGILFKGPSPSVLGNRHLDRHLFDQRGQQPNDAGQRAAFLDDYGLLAHQMSAHARPYLMLVRSPTLTPNLSAISFFSPHLAVFRRLLISAACSRVSLVPLPWRQLRSEERRVGKAVS